MHNVRLNFPTLLKPCEGIQFIHLIVPNISNCVETQVGEKTVVTGQNNHWDPITAKYIGWKLIEVQVCLSDSHLAPSNAIGNGILTSLSSNSKIKSGK